MTGGSAASAESRPGRGDLGQRGRSAVLFVLVFLGAALAGALPFALLLGVVSILSAWELRRVLRALGWGGGAPLVVLAPAVFLLALFAVGPGGLAPVAGAALLVLTGWLFRPVAPRLGNAGRAGGALALATAALYVGLLPAFLVRLHSGPWAGSGAEGAGAGWVVFSAGLVWAADTGAYLVGVRFGRHRLWEAVSPKKSWEGCLGGLAGAVGAALLLAGPLRTGLDPLAALGIGALAALGAPLGDLIESRLKRVAGVKDSGRLIPGHGGVLDRFDSLFYCAPLFYYYLHGVAGRF